jgi:tRNA G37 N-methylase Trm5
MLTVIYFTGYELIDYKTCEFFLLDLNPESYKYLLGNAKSNKCELKVKCYNLDGRAFILNIAQDKIFPHEVCLK